MLLEWGDGRTAALSVGGEETIVAAAESNGVGLPYGCLTGACATCAARLLDGAVTHRRPPRALKPEHLADGYVLPCIATPDSDCRLRVGADVQAELVTNPWK